MVVVVVWAGLTVYMILNIIVHCNYGVVVKPSDGLYSFLFAYQSNTDWLFATKVRTFLIMVFVECVEKSSLIIVLSILHINRWQRLAKVR